MSRGSGGIWAKVAALTGAVALVAVGLWFGSGLLSPEKVNASAPPAAPPPQATQPVPDSQAAGAQAPAKPTKIISPQPSKTAMAKAVPAGPVIGECMAEGPARMPEQGVTMTLLPPGYQPPKMGTASKSSETRLIRAVEPPATFRGIAPVRGYCPTVMLERRPAVPGNIVFRVPEEGEVQGSKEIAAWPEAVDLPPVQGDTVTVRDLPPISNIPKPLLEANEGEKPIPPELREQLDKMRATNVQDATAPDAPRSTFVPTDAEAAPVAGTPSFQEYSVPNGWSGGPPDVDMAAGLSYIITDLNCMCNDNVQLKIYNKTGALQQTVGISTFFNSGGATPNCGNSGNNTCDPQCVYDDQNDRYIFTCLTITATTSYVCLACSQTGDARGTWNKYEFQTVAGDIGDYPHTAVGEDAIFVGQNLFNMTGTTFLGACFTAVQKSAVEAVPGTAITPRVYNAGASPYNPRPVVRRGSGQGQYPPAGTAHFWMVDDATYNAKIWQWPCGTPCTTFTTNPAVIASWTDNVPGTAVNPAEAAYTNNAIDALNNKVMDGEIRWPHLWFVRTGLDANSRDIIRWADVDMTTPTAPATVAGHSGSTGGGTTEHWWMPDCTIDKNNSLAVAFMRAGTTGPILVGAYVTGHDNGTNATGAGLLETPVAAKAGEVVFTGALQSGRYRDGDYSGCQIDPNGCDIWVHGEYAFNNTVNSQKDATWVRKFAFADCTPGCTRIATMNKPLYQCHNTVTATITDTAGMGACPAVDPTNAVYHSTTGANLPATISGSSPNYTVSAVTTDALGAVDGNDIWLSFTGDDGGTYTSAHSKLDCTLQVCVGSVDAFADGCDNDHYMDEGETLQLVVNMKNNEAYDLPTGFTATLTTTDPNTTIVNGTATYDVIGANLTDGPISAPFSVRYTGALANCKVTVPFTISVTAIDYSWTSGCAAANLSFTKMANADDQKGASYSGFPQGFEGVTPPAFPTNWTSVVVVTGTNPPAWVTYTGTMPHGGTAPGTAHGGTIYAGANSFTASSGTQARLQYNVNENTAASAQVAMSYWMWHDGQYSNKDYLIPQSSTDGGTTWVDAGTANYRFISGVNAWQQRIDDLSATAGGKATVRVGILAHEMYGNDCYVDDIDFYAVNQICQPTNCTTSAPVISYSDGNWWFDDSMCNNLGDWANGIPSPDAGESGSLIIYLDNTGTDSAYNVQGTLTCPSCPTGTVICKSTANYGTIPNNTGLAYGPGDNGFFIALPTAMTAGADLPFVMTLTATGYTPPTVNTVTSPHSPANTRGGTRTAQGACVSPYNGTTGTFTDVSYDNFTTVPTTTGTGGRCGPSWATVAWTGTGTTGQNTTVATPTGDTRSGSFTSRAAGAGLFRKFDTTGLAAADGADVRMHAFIELGGTTASTLHIQYTSDGTNFYDIATGTGYGTTNAWANFGGSIYWSIYDQTGTGYGPAAANAIFNNPNFGIRYWATAGSGAYLLDDVEVDMYKFVNQATTCTGTCSAPGQPAILSIIDNNACLQNGIKVYFDGSLGAASYNLMKDGVALVTGYTSGALANPTDSLSHSYTIRAVNTWGNTDSVAQNFTDAAQSCTPTITCNPGTCISPASVILTTEQGQSSYQWYVGGVIIGGATTYTYTATASGTYTVKYTAGACATNLSAGKVVTIGGGGPKRVAYSVNPTKMTTANHGTDGSVTWDVASCTSTNYHIIYGKGENVSTLDGTTPTVDGGKCAIGTSGTYSWTTVPDPSTYTSRYLWFLVIGDNGSTTEGSWGLTVPGGLEEGRTTACGYCTMATHDNSNTCGTP